MENKKSLYITSAVCAALSMAATTNASAAKGYMFDGKHCWGAALAGKNHCGADQSTCKGTATTDCDMKDWLFAKSEEECKKLVGQNCPQNL